MQKVVLCLAAAVLVAAFTARAGLTAGLTPSWAGPSGSVSSMDANDQVIEKYCGNCHNDDDLKGELSLDGFTVAAEIYGL